MDTAPPRPEAVGGAVVPAMCGDGRPLRPVLPNRPAGVTKDIGTAGMKEIEDGLKRGEK